MYLKKAKAFRIGKNIFVLKAKQEKITCLSFDFIQNLPLPLIPPVILYITQDSCGQRLWRL